MQCFNAGDEQKILFLVIGAQIIPTLRVENGGVVENAGVG